MVIHTHVLFTIDISCQNNTIPLSLQSDGCRDFIIDTLCRQLVLLSIIELSLLQTTIDKELVMIVWTQQNLAFWEALERDGIAYCMKESWLYKECSYAYDWLVSEMQHRLSPPPVPEIRLPLWCWTQYGSYKIRKPKFSPSKDGNGNYSEVLIEADIPDELLLQSNFYLWSCHCLNGWQIGDKKLEKEIEEYDHTHNTSGKHFLSYPEDLQQRITKSWECIFNLDYRNRRYHNHPRRNKPIQATFWLFKREWIRSVRFSK